MSKDDEDKKKRPLRSPIQKRDIDKLEEELKRDEEEENGIFSGDGDSGAIVFGSPDQLDKLLKSSSLPDEIKDVVREIHESHTHKNHKPKVLQKVRPTEAEATQWAEIERVRRELETLSNQEEMLRRAFWAGVELRLDHFGQMRVNDNGIIEILEEHDD